MTIIVEDGSIVGGANSYVTTSELTAYATARGVTLTTGAEQLLIQSMDYIEGLYYKGIKLRSDQPLQWPRSNVVVDGYLLNNDEIPNDLKNGQMQCAIAIDEGNDPLATIVKDTVKEKVGELEVQYSNSSVSAPVNIKISNSLKKLLASGGNGSVMNVNKG